MSMIKENADKLIIEYSPKIYGFAVKKAFSLEESEELAAEMVKEVYLSLLEANEVFNVEGYVWRICEHTYAKYVNSTKKHQGISLDGMEIPYYDNYNLGEKYGLGQDSSFSGWFELKLAEEDLQVLHRDYIYAAGS